MPPGGTSSLHFDSSGFTPLLRKRSVPSRRESLHLGPRYLAMFYILDSGASDAALLRRTAPVVRDGRHVLDAGDLQAGGVQRAHGGLAARAGTAHADLDVLQAVFLRGDPRLLGGDLRGERRALARAADTATARRRPRQGVALAVGDRDDRVVERGVHVRDAVGDHALGALAGLAGGRGLLLLVVGHEGSDSVSVRGAIR